MKLKLVKHTKKGCFKLFLFILCWFQLIGFAGAESLIADGIGKSKDLARANALANLSQQILVNVSSATRSSIVSDNDSVERNAETEVNLQSDIRFQGVEFSKFKKKFRGGWSVNAILTDDALKQTIYYLDERLPKNIDGLTSSQVTRSHQEVEQLQALLHFASQQKLPISRQAAIEVRARSVSDALKLRIGNYGWVRFLPPTNVHFNDNFIIEIDDEQIKTSTKVFLTVGEHRYRILRKNYATEEGRLRISRGREERTNLFLVKLPSDPVRLKIDVQTQLPETKEIIENALTEILTRYQVIIDERADLTLRARADAEYNESIENFEHLFVSLGLNFIKGKKAISSHQEALRLFGADEDSISQYQWQKLAEKTLSYLLAGDGLFKLAENATATAK